MEIGKNKCGMKKCPSNRMTEALGRTSYAGCICNIKPFLNQRHYQELLTRVKEIKNSTVAHAPKSFFFVLDQINL